MNLGLGLFLRGLFRSGFVGQILTGSGAPGAGLGVDGDYYYDTASFLDLYGPKTAGAWPSATNLAPGGTDGNVLVAGGGHYAGLSLPASPKGKQLRVGEASGAVKWLPPTHWTAYDRLTLAEAFRREEAGTATAFSAGGGRYTRIRLHEDASVTGVQVFIGVAGVACTNCYAGIARTTDLSLIATTADQSTDWQSVGLKQKALVGGPYMLSAGDYFVVMFAGGFSSAPQFQRLAPMASTNWEGMGLDANGRAGSFGSGLTSLPSPLPTLTAGVTIPYGGIYQ